MLLNTYRHSGGLPIMWHVSMLHIVRMKTTRYFDSLSTRPDRAEIRHDWIEKVVEQPEREQIQADGRIRRWGCIPEAGDRYLRVVLLDDGETVHNVFFDRGFKS